MDAAEHHAWNPGLESDIPRRLQGAVTLFRPENATRDHAEARELAELIGAEASELAALRPERLVVHELLVRVTADLTVPDGPAYADLGLNLREMVRTLLERHLAPEMDGIRTALETERERAVACLERQLRELFADADADADDAREAGRGREEGDAPSARPWFARWLGLGGKAASPPAARAPNASRGGATPAELPEIAVLATWRARLEAAAPGLEHDCLGALVRTVGGMTGQRGRLFADRARVREVALALVGAERDAALVGALVGPIVERAIDREGYRRLPTQEEPVVMNVKGASAAGKSTIRPQQRALADALGIRWEDFALVSPDYWRKYLLDYDSLGEDFRYAAMLTGRELEIVDRKLDRYMAEKASRGHMSHLLIDRFRFDSFTLDENRAEHGRLLTRFGHRLFLFFLITSPVELVERAWVRGLQTGRYKAVSDLLHHDIEAYTGMPALFLSWVNDTERRVHFEFLDNDVPKGTLPRTVAFGWNGEMTVLDVEKLLDVERFRKVRLDARAPHEVLDGVDRSADANLDFVRACLARIDRVRFADRETGQVYARFEGGRLTWRDRGYVDALPAGKGAGAALAAATPGESGDSPDAPPQGVEAARERRFTVGRWGPGGDR